MGISWQYSSEIQIQGGAYFAVTPQCLMGGGRLSAICNKYDIAGSGSDVNVNFQAWADFLINYHPFRYVGDVGASIFMKIKANLLVATKTYTLNPTATLHAEGPPFSGTLVIKRVPVIGTVTVDFGPKDKGPVLPLFWDQFLDVVLQSTDWRTAKDKDGKLVPPRGHVISLVGGSMDGVGGARAEKKPNEEPKIMNDDSPMVVRTGLLIINVQSKIPIKSYSVQSGTRKDAAKELFFKPMQISTTVESVMTVDVSGDNVPSGIEFVVQESPVNVPGGLWGKCMLSLQLSRLPPPPS